MASFFIQSTAESHWEFLSMGTFLGRQIYQFVKVKYSERDSQCRENTSKKKNLRKKIGGCQTWREWKRTTDRGKGNMVREARGEPKVISRKGRPLEP